MGESAELVAVVVLLLSWLREDDEVERRSGRRSAGDELEELDGEEGRLCERERTRGATVGCCVCC